MTTSDRMLHDRIMAKNVRDTRLHQRTLLLFIVSIFLIAGMMFAVAQNTNFLSFAYTQQQMQQFCLSRFTPEQCSRLTSMGQGPQISDPVLAQWCSEKCRSLDQGAKLCKEVCLKVNTGGSCQGACKKIQQPVVASRCQQICPTLVKPGYVTPTPTRTP